MFSMAWLGLRFSGAAFEQLCVPLLTEFSYQRLAEEMVELYPFPFSAFSAGSAFRNCFIPDERLSDVADAYREEVARERFAPGASAFKKRPLEPAPGDSPVDIHEHAFAAIDAGSRIGARRSLHKTFPIYHRDIPGVKVFLDQRIVLGNPYNFSVFQGCTSPAFQRATRPRTCPEIATKRG
jgi:hypothetical protein